MKIKNLIFALLLFCSGIAHAQPTVNLKDGVTNSVTVSLDATSDNLNVVVADSGSAADRLIIYAVFLKPYREIRLTGVEQSSRTKSDTLSPGGGESKIYNLFMGSPEKLKFVLVGTEKITVRYSLAKTDISPIGTLLNSINSVNASLGNYAGLNKTNFFLQGNIFSDSFYVKNGGLTNVARTDTINGGNINTSGSFQINGVSINTNGTLNNVAYLNGNNAYTGRPSWLDLATFNDSVNIGSATLNYLNGRLNLNKPLNVSDTVTSLYVSSGSYYMGTTRILFTISNNLHINSRASNDLLLGTGTAGSVWTFQSALGNVVYTPVSLSGSLATPIFDISQTWNTSGTPTAFKLNIVDNGSNSNSLLMDIQRDGSSRFSVSKSGNGVLSGSLSISGVFTGSSNGFFGGRGSFGNSSGQTNTQLYVSQSNNITSGTSRGINNEHSFLPTSGTGVFNGIEYSGTINQTGGANGITRGLFINPTLTAFADWRAIETTSGSLVMADTSLANGGSLAGSLINLTQKWNTSGTPTAIKLNVVNINSQTNSFLMDLQVNGISVFNIRKDGKVQVGSLTSSSDIGLGINNAVTWSTRSAIASPTNNSLLFYSNNGGGLSSIFFQAQTSSYPAFFINGTGLDLKVGDNSAFTNFQTLYRRYGTGSPEGVVTAPPGAIYNRTDGTSGTLLYFKDSGTGNTGWVAKW